MNKHFDALLFLKEAPKKCLVTEHIEKATNSAKKGGIDILVFITVT